MDLRLAGNIVLVTGGSKGIGFACARVLSAEGAHVILSSRSADNLERAAEQIRKETGREPGTVVADVSLADDIRALGSYVSGRYERLDGLLINAGGPPLGASLEHDDAAWYKALDTQLMSGGRLAREFVPLMRKNRYGRIVAITSTGVKQALAGLVLSNAARMGLAGFLKTLATEVAADQVYINTLMPGPTDTERLRDILEKNARAQNKSVGEVVRERISQVPAGKFGDPDDLAALAAFLLSPRNNFITAQAIAVDGGYLKGNL